ncbi:hypothetical protein [Leucobacter sp. gxy201]|uniref:hypothetical protein n=1 Tax=Leucobacter sp. gxy201 TaxID=2957200 RepID=UPI003DA035E7
MESEAFARALREGRRKERRDGVLLLVVGAVFIAAGVLLIVVGNRWLGATGAAFGAMAVCTGIAHLRGSESAAARIPVLLIAIAMVVTGVLAVIAGIATPGAWGWRGGGAGVVAGVLFLVLGAAGIAAFIIASVRRRRHRV